MRFLSANVGHSPIESGIASVVFISHDLLSTFFSRSQPLQRLHFRISISPLLLITCCLIRLLRLPLQNSGFSMGRNFVQILSFIRRAVFPIDVKDGASVAMLWLYAAVDYHSMLTLSPC